MTPKDRIIFALDVPSRSAARRYVRLLKDRVGLFKVGLELFVSEGPDIVRCVVEEAGRGVFLDLKFHDIPETVIRAVLALHEKTGENGIRFITVHAGVGRVNLRHVADRTPSGIGILAVTLLTSLGREELRELHYRKEFVDNPSLLVEERARSAREAGCVGVVCSGQEVQRIKECFGKDLVVVTPGIRPLWSVVGQDDQKRIVTPSQASSYGADYIVVGRPIRDAEDPAAAADRIAQEVGEGLKAIHNA